MTDIRDIKENLEEQLISSLADDIKSIIDILASVSEAIQGDNENECQYNILRGGFLLEFMRAWQVCWEENKAMAEEERGMIDSQKIMHACAADIIKLRVVFLSEDDDDDEHEVRAH